MNHRHCQRGTRASAQRTSAQSHTTDLKEISFGTASPWMEDRPYPKEEYGRRRKKRKLRIEEAVRAGREVGAKGGKGRGESPPTPRRGVGRSLGTHTAR